jgi:aldehyde dehydrogenase (NAD+)
MNNFQNVLLKQKHFYETQVTKDIKFRKKQLRKLYSIIKMNEAEILNSLYSDFHKPAFEGYATEVGLTLNEIRQHIGKIKNWASSKRAGGNILDFIASARIYPEPRGQVLIISPWNYPFQLLMTPLAGAISAGNTIIVKPSENAPATSALIKKMISENFNEEYIYCVEGGQAETTELLKQKFDFIFFTGSEKVGQIVMKAAAENLCPLCLELGGKSPCIIDKTAAIDLTSKRIVWGKFINAGQTCVAPDYILVHKDVSSELKKGLAKYIKLFYGEDPQKSSDFARIINLNHFKRISDFIDPEKVYYGGKTDEKELYISPTVLENISISDKIMQEEIFGPVLPVIEYSETSEIREIIKCHPKPLSFYVFSKDKAFRKKMINEIEAGNGNLNDTVMQFANKNIPFGGKGKSGTGAYHGKYSFDCFSHFKAVNRKSLLIDLPFRYPPYNATKLRLIKWLLK